MLTSEQLKIGMIVRRNTRTWVDGERLGIKNGMIGEVLKNETCIGVRVRFENGVDTYCWGDDLDPVELPICDYCNNPVASGKHVHEQCVERFDEREETADRNNESQ